MTTTTATADKIVRRRVAEVVRREFGVDYHPDHLGRIVVVMDRLNVHRSAVRKLHERGATWLDVERPVVPIEAIALR